MDPKVLYWTAAFVNLAVIAGLVLRGVVHIRRGDVVRHRRAMLTGAWLVAAFLVSYGLKVAFLGREDLSVWSAFQVHTLRLHETCVLAMLVAGSVALTRVRRMRGSRNVTRDPADPPAPESTARWHRRAGWTGVIGALTGLASAGVVLAGMYARL